MNKNKWQEVSLGDVCTLYYGKALTSNNRINGKIPVYSSAGITGWHNKALLDSEGIIIGRKGTVGTVFFSNTPFYCIDTAYYIKPDKKFNLKFLYYKLKTLGLNFLNEDSAVPGLNRETAYAQRFLFPPYKEQTIIADTLSCLDDRIELNNRMNQVLEQMAQAIFKSWFVDFEPFCDGEFQYTKLGEIPVGWCVGSIGNYCKIKSGYAFKSAWWQENGVKVLKIKNIGSNYLDISDCSYVSENKIAYAKDFIVSGGELLIAMTGATIGKFAIVPKCNETLLVNQRVGKFFLGKNPIARLPFIYCILKQDAVFNEIVNRGQGSAQPNISPTDIETIPIVLPPDKVINDFNNTLCNAFELFIQTHYENKRLTDLRDTLIPKLLSGELGLSDVTLAN